MNFSGFVKTSLIDYPGKVAAVVFTQGCNFRCGFCHNPDLIPLRTGNNLQLISDSTVLTYLEKRKNVLDGVVVTGGEPLIGPEIKDFITKVKSLGLKVKLDTNGSNPVLLKSLIDEQLIDYVAMDIKGPLDSYEKICGHKDTEKIRKSIDLLLADVVDYEFRTTVLPYYHQISDFEKIGLDIKGAKKYTVQGFRPAVTLNPALGSERAFTRVELTEIEEMMKAYVREIVVHDNL